MNPNSTSGLTQVMGAVRTTAAVVALALAMAASLLATAPPAQAVQVPHDVLVSAVPTDITPHVLDGRVLAIAVAGDRVVVGGTFTQFRPSTSTTLIQRPYIFSFDRVTGAIDSAFAPTINGDVESIGVAADGTSVIVGGNFTTVNGLVRRNVVKLDIATGAVDPGFVANTAGRVRDLVVVGDRVYLGGTFTHVNGAPQQIFAAIDAGTGDLQPDLSFAFGLPNGTGAAVQILKLDVTPDQTRAVVIGNFGSVDGQSRPQVAMFDLTTAPASLAPWHTARYGQRDCSTSFHSYMRDVDIAPDGSYMVIVTTGAYRAGRLCDTAARWETSSVGESLQPTWVNYTGGDTLYSVGITGEVVYIGGHNRWLNNSFAADRAGPGAVSREGIAALDPLNGLPYSWNPGRTLGVGLFDIVSTADGLYVGSDTDRIADYRYRGRLAMFPTAGGAPIPPAEPGPLPGTLLSGSSTGLVQRSFDGTTLGAGSAVTGMDWSTVRGAMMLSGTLYTAHSNGSMQQRTYDGTTFGSASTMDLHGLTATQFPVASLTGMSFDALTGRLYYTVSGSNQLLYRWFTPESGVLGADTFVASQGIAGLDWRTVTGMHLHGADLYLTTTGGNLRRLQLQGGVPVAGSLVPVSGPAVGDGISWDGRGLFLYSGPAFTQPNGAPTAEITVTCEATTCQFGSTGSTDPDGSIVGFGWQFSDGTTSDQPGVSHTFGDGDHVVTLTVTDDDGATGSATVPLTFALPPTAALSVSCTDLACTFDGSASSDGVGIESFVWDFGDGQSGEGVSVSHSYAAGGSYAVTLTVTDADGLAASATETVTVAAPVDEIILSGADGVNGNLSTFSVEVPAEVRGGDLLVLFGSFASSGVNPQPVGLEGWTPIDSVTTSAMRTSAWWRIAETGDEGQTVTLLPGQLVKGDVTLLAYDGARADAPVVAAAAVGETVSRAVHTTPVLSSGLDDGLVLSYWADRTSGTTSWALPGDQDVRREGYGTGGGRISAVVSDRVIGAAGDQGGVVATATAASSNATMWTVLLAGAEVDQVPALPPTADAVVSCTDLTCTFDGAGSSDPDGTIESFAWDFGDGQSGEGVSVSHAYAAGGSFQATLTVTDSDGLTASAAQEVTVVAPITEVTFVGVDGINRYSTSFPVTVPATAVPGDVLLLYASVGSSTTTLTPPAGWASLGRLTDQTMASEAFYRVVTPGDAGSLITVTSSQAVKGDVVVAAYTGTDPVAPIAASGGVDEPAFQAAHTTPVVSSPVPGVEVAYWADMSSATTGWTAPADHTARRVASGTGGGRISSLLAEGAAGAAGPRGDSTAVADSANGKATMWTVVLANSG